MSFVERIKVTDGTEVASVNASNQLEVAEANSNAIKTAVELIDNAISGNEMQVDIVAPLPAGTNNIGDVDVLTVPAPLNVTGSGLEASALRVTIASDSTGVLSVDDNGSTLSIDDGGGSITVDGTFWQATQPVSIAAAVAVTDNSGSLTVDDGGLTLSIDDGGGTITVDGTVSITANSSVNVAQVGGTNVVTGGTAGTQAIGGIQAHDAAISNNNPVLIGAYANNESGPTGVANGDLSRLWCNNQGALVIAGQYQTLFESFVSDTVCPLRMNGDGRVITSTLIESGTNYIGKVRLTDGTTDAEVVPLAGYNAQAVAIVDGSGNQITSFGGGTQYTEGDTDATITGTAMMFETNTGTSALGVVSASNPLPISDNGTTLSIDDGGGIITVDGTVSITANSAVNVAQFGGTNVVNGGTAGTQAIGGIQAHDAALSNNNPVLGGSYYALTPSDVASGDLTRTWGSPKGATIIGAKYESSPPNWAFSGDTVYHLTLASDGRLRVDVDFTGKSIATAGNVAHDALDTGNPIKIGAKAIAHGTNPTAVAAADRTDLYANRHGILWTISGHPNLQTAEYFTDAARTNDNVLPLISAGTKYVITGITVIANAANTVNVSVRIGFGAAAVPTQGASGADAVNQVVLSHPNIPPGSGFSKGHAGGIVGIGGDGEDLYITCSAPTTGSLIVQVDYYTIES